MPRSSIRSCAGHLSRAPFPLSGRSALRRSASALRRCSKPRTCRSATGPICRSLSMTRRYRATGGPKCAPSQMRGSLFGSTPWAAVAVEARTRSLSSAPLRSSPLQPGQRQRSRRRSLASTLLPSTRLASLLPWGSPSSSSPAPSPWWARCWSMRSRRRPTHPCAAMMQGFRHRPTPSRGRPIASILTAQFPASMAHGGFSQSWPQSPTPRPSAMSGTCACFCWWDMAPSRSKISGSGQRRSRPLMAQRSRSVRAGRAISRSPSTHRV